MEPRLTPDEDRGRDGGFEWGKIKVTLLSHCIAGVGVDGGID